MAGGIGTASMELTTPALLFPAISLLLLAYTNRFLVLGQLIRELARQLANTDNSGTRPRLLRQVGNLQKRVRLIIWMQALGVLSFITCTLTMLSLYCRYTSTAHALFAVSLLTMVTSLLLSLREIAISGDALDIQLEDLREELGTD